MKKLLSLLLVLLALLTALVLPISAQQPVNQLTNLAQYAPAESIFYAGFRTDDDMINTLDDVFQRTLVQVARTLDEPVPDVSLRDGLTEFFGFSEPDQTFDNTIRPWLGDHAALFLPSLERLMSGTSSTPVTFVAEITNFDAAVAYLDALHEFDIEFGDMEKVEQADGSVLYEPTVSFLSPTLVTSDLLFLGDVEAAALAGEDVRRLNNVAEFQDVVNALPLSEYNGLVYINPAPVIELVASFGPMMLGPQMPQFDAAALAETVGRQALGFTLLQDRVLVMDYAQVGSMTTMSEPLDLSLLDRVPEDSAFVLLNQGLGRSVQSLLDAFYVLNDWLTTAGALPAEEAGPLAFLGPDDIAKFVTLSLEGTFNIDLEETLAWMNGDHVLFIRPNVTDNMLTSGMDTGFLLTTDNPAATAALLDKIAENVMRQFGAATYQNGRLTVPLGAIVGQPQLGTFEVFSSENFFAIGTGSGTLESMLNPATSITAGEGYQFASGLFLENPTMLLFVNGESIREAMLQLMDLDPAATNMERAEANAVFSLIQSAAISVTETNNVTTARFMIALSN